MAEMIIMTALSPTMEEGRILQWLKKEGDTIASGDALCEVETDKASMDLESSEDGILLKILVDAGTQAHVGQLIGVIGESGEDITNIIADAQQAKPQNNTAEQQVPSPTTQTQKQKIAPQSTHLENKRHKSSPLARKIAQQKGIDIMLVTGSGPNGRVIRKDIEAFVNTTQPQTTSAHTMQAEDIKIPIDGKRKLIASRLSESKFSAPHFYVKLHTNMTQIIAARTMLNAELKDTKISFNAFLIKFVAESIKKHPSINVSWQGDHIIQFTSIDIGLAVDLGNGLITPIIRNCGMKTITTIETELKVLINKVRDGKLQPQEYTGATFTISNLGSFGVDEFTAIINPPGAAILALGKTEKRAIVNQKTAAIEVQPMMTMTLSSDHRVIDGALAARFMSELHHSLENPVRVLF